MADEVGSEPQLRRQSYPKDESYTQEALVPPRMITSADATSRDLDSFFFAFRTHRTHVYQPPRPKSSSYALCHFFKNRPCLPAAMAQIPHYPGRYEVTAHMHSDSKPNYEEGVVG